jgi:beta-lactam-binding protein with PASTA domain
MALQSRAWGVSKIVLVLLGLVTTYVLFALASARVALRAREVTIPDLRGRTVSAATTGLAELNLSLRVDDARRLDPDIRAGDIVAQDLAPGTTARRGRTVRVWLSGGAHASTVPALVGESERMARLRLEQDGLTLAVVSEMRSNDQAPGVVVAQEPAPGIASDHISLLVNRGDRSTAYLMPDLIGVEANRAADILRSAGFRVAIVGQQPYPGVAAGIVLRQSPQAGFQISPSDPISLEVSQ